jgi:molybdopterin molybdotransferase
VITLKSAQARILEEVRALPAETVELAGSLGRVLAESVSADIEVPPFPRAAMDGFAIHAEDIRRSRTRLSLSGESRAGAASASPLRPREAVRIMTGAPVPPGAGAVVPVEETRVTPDGAGIEILVSPDPGQHIAPAGSEAHKGDELLAPGHVIDAAAIAVLALAGKAQVRVGGRPELALVVSGDELRPLSERPADGTIRDTNGPTLRALAESAGARFVDLGRVRDDRELVRAKLSQGLDADILVASGGVSAGDYDFVKPTLKELGVRVSFEAVAVKPGKPVVFGVHGRTLVFGLPGNPVSAQVAFALFVAPALLAMQGGRARPHPRADVVLAEPLHNRAKRLALMPARVQRGDGLLKAWPLPSRGSADVVRHALADALIEMPPGAEAAAGSVAAAILLGPRWGRGGPW